jgi:hypothetical protein
MHRQSASQPRAHLLVFIAAHHREEPIPVDSALAKHARVDRTLTFPPDHQHVVRATGHLDLLDSVEAFETMRSWLGRRSSRS